MSNLFLKLKLIPLSANALLLLPLGLLLLNSHTFAQSATSNERWYQIELVVFSQTLDPIDTGENWPKDIALAYPPGTVLLSPEAQSPEAEEVNELTAETPTSENDLTPSEQNGVSIAITDASEEIRLEAPVIAQSFKNLPDEQLTLTAQKNRLKQNNRYRVLKHLAWRQPIAEKTTAKSVVITGGDQFGDHFELEGTISVSASRYLHLETNLWLTQFYPNLGVDESTNLWPNLPEIPAPVAKTTHFSDSNNLSFNQNAETQYNQFGSLNSDIKNNTSTFSTFTTNESVSRKPYLIDQIILLSQSRKMRSNELHYIDHPAIGVLAKITPWEPETVNKIEF